MVRTWIPVPPNLVEQDKRQHFKAGCVISLVAGILALACDVPVLWSVIFGVATASVAGLVKEIWDVVKPGPTGFNYADLWATIMGGLPSALLVGGLGGMMQSV